MTKPVFPSAHCCAAPRPDRSWALPPSLCSSRFFGGTNFASLSGAASWLNVAASLGIIAIPIGLLMIAGELDISIGSLVPAGSMTVRHHIGLLRTADIVWASVAALGLGRTWSG